MGVVGRPSAVTGLAAISIIAEMTFMPGRHSSSNFSHTAGASGLAWRLISSAMVLSAMIPLGPLRCGQFFEDIPSAAQAPKLFLRRIQGPKGPCSLRYFAAV